MNSAIENRFSQRLVRHHLPLAVVSLAAIWLLYWFVGYWLNTTDPKFFYFRLSLSTGYVALALLVVTLSIGAINILRERRIPISSDWRRDVGIWCALVSVAHFIFGWNVHQKHRWHYFLPKIGLYAATFSGLPIIRDCWRRLSSLFYWEYLTIFRSGGSRQSVGNFYKGSITRSPRWSSHTRFCIRFWRNARRV